MLASTSNTPGKSPVRKLRTLGSVRGAPSNGRPYRDHAPPERLHASESEQAHCPIPCCWIAEAGEPRQSHEFQRPLRSCRHRPAGRDRQPVQSIYRTLDDDTAHRLRIWLMRRRGKRGTEYRRYSDQYLHEGSTAAISGGGPLVRWRRFSFEPTYFSVWLKKLIPGAAPNPYRFEFFMPSRLESQVGISSWGIGGAI